MTNTTTETSTSTTSAVTTTASTNLHLNIENFTQGEMKWDRWIQRLEIGFSYYSIPEDKKVMCLLFHLSAKAFDSLCDFLNGAEPSALTYNELKQKLKTLFAPKAIEIAENFKFYNRKQLPNEDISVFTNALNSLSLQCNFGEFKTKALLNQFVVGVRDTRLQRRLLETADLTYDKAVQAAIAMELTDKEANTITQNKNATVHALHTDRKHVPNNQKNKDKSSKTSTSNRGNSRVNTFSKIKCYRCGRSGHKANSCKTDPKTLTCGSCNKKGHVTDVCLNRRANANQVDEYDNESNSDEEMFDFYAIDDMSQLEQVEDREKFLKILQVNNVAVTFEIDSGAAVSIMWDKDAQRLFKGSTVHHTKTKLIAYCKTRIPVTGYITVNVKYASANFEVNLYITTIERPPIAGREWLRKLIRAGGAEQLFDNTPQICSVECEKERKERVDKLLSTYHNCIKKDLSKITGIKATLTLRENTRPVFLKARPLPFKLTPLVNNELDRLETAGVLIKVNTSEYATPVVPVLKKDKTVRLCGDYSVSVNPNLIVDEHPLPTTDEMFASLAECEHFCKIDLKEAYLQLEVDEDSSKLLTINTHKGLYRPTRLMYGIASACAIWQRVMENLLKGIEGVFVLLDDIRIAGKTISELLERLELVLKKLHEHNIKINMEKCDFFHDKIEFCGYVIDKFGLHKNNKKIEAIKDMPRPQNVSEVRSFIGFVSYYSHFIPNVSKILQPLHNLLQKETKFIWSEACEKAFLEAKNEFISDKCLTFYDPNLPLILATDASPTGVGAVLSHKFPDGTEKPIRFISKSLNNTQKKYAQIDKEAHAIVFAVKKLHKYLYGGRFTLVTDHRPLTQIFSLKNSLPTYSALRMQHYAIFLRAYNYDIVYKRSENNSNADGLSRLPITCKTEHPDVIDLFYLDTLQTLPITSEVLQSETKSDKNMCKIIKALREGKQLRAKDTWNIDPREFSLEQGTLVRNQRIVVPQALRNRVLQELHVGHFGIVRMKALARGHCWWPNINSEIENLAKNCASCLTYQHRPPGVEKHIWQPPTRPFERVHMDYAGPFQNKYFLILVDAYTKWPEVYVTRGMTSKETMTVCKRIFSTFGIPDILVSDNYSSFKSDEFTNFTKELGIIQKFIAPYNPSTNGQAERYVQTIKEALTKMENKGDFESNLQDILLQYRITPHTVTGVSPAKLMFNRDIRSKLDLMKSNMSKKKDIKYNENKRIREFQIKQRVEARNYGGSKLWLFGKIAERTGRLHYKITLDDGRTWLRHVDQIRPIGQNVSTTIPNRDDDYHVPIDEQINVFPTATERAADSRNTSLVSNASSTASSQSANTSSDSVRAGRGRGRGRGITKPNPADPVDQPGRPRRQTSMPAHLKDYVLG